MKAAISISRIFTGILFIFSGLIKANDPLSLGYKMQEFFEIWNDGLGKSSFFLARPLVSMFDFLHEHSLALAIVMIAFEIMAGAALLFGWRMKLFGWLLLLLIIFFTFLTGYALLSGKFKNCGCFGDCLPISPKTSFLKDILLTILIGFLFWYRNKIRPLFSEKITALSMLALTLFSFGIQWYVLTYLPFADCLPFKKGNNISEKMKMPANAIPDSVVITFVYDKEGKIVEFTADKFPVDFKTPPYIFKSRYDKIVRKGKNNEPPIKGFVLSGVTDTDSTEFVLSHPYSILLFCENFSEAGAGWKNSFSKLYAAVRSKNIPVYIVTAQPGEAPKALAETSFAGIQIFKCDYKTILTAARTNPCLYLLKQGTVAGKWSYKKMDDGIKAVDQIPFQPVTGNQQP